ncbi:uncharacterized protein [Centruroides vittatus]|uniref:uncharacterized protein n=1 Tax=Centruroides vittatus TaxID=120091 RepID=UPI00350F105B
MDWETSVQEIERGIVGLDDLEKEYFRWKAVLNNRQRGRKQDFRSSDIRLTKNWLKHNDLVLTRADKSKQLVIMKRSTYNEALMDYIEKTECEKINSNLIGSLDRRVRKLEVSKLSKVLPFLKKCRNPRPGTPRLFAFAKVHKTGKEIRPVVEKCRGPTFVLEKKLHEYLSLQLDTDTLVARDPMKVVKDLQSIALMEDEVATVFDYESMYPSVRIESCEEALLDFLYSNNSELLSYTEEVESLTSLVCRESCFVFNGQVYRQRRGVPMGSPLSGILCELVVRRLERRIFHGFKDDIVYFSRYVDDLLILWRSNSRIKDFLDKINDNNDGLTLRLEQKSSLNLHFLDIDITFKKGHLSTSVFIKPSHSPLYIPSQSKDPYKYKIAAFRALIRRAFLYCERVQDRTKEINRIINVARTLGYQKSTILGIIKKYEHNIKKGCFRNAPNKFVDVHQGSPNGDIMFNNLAQVTVPASSSPLDCSWSI